MPDASSSVSDSGEVPDGPLRPAPKRCKDGHRRPNGRWEARHRPKSPVILDHSNPQVASAYRGIDPRTRLHKYEWLQYFDSKREKDAFLQAKRDLFKLAKNHAVAKKTHEFRSVVLPPNGAEHGPNKVGMLSLEAWVNTLPMLSDTAKEAIFADVHNNAEDLDEVASGGSSAVEKPSLTKIEELLHDDMRIFKQDLAELKETLRRCEAQIKHKFPQQQTDDGETRLSPSPDDGASMATGSFRPAKRPHIPDLQLSSGATKKQKATASTTCPPVSRQQPLTMTTSLTTKRKGILSDTAWAKHRSASSRDDLPVQRPVYVQYRSDNGKWRYARSGLTYDTIEAAYDAAIRDRQHHDDGDSSQNHDMESTTPSATNDLPSPAISSTSTTTTKRRKVTMSDTAWARERATSLRDLPAQRPVNVTFCSPGCWQYRCATTTGKNTSYQTIEAVYDAAIKDQQQHPPVLHGARGLSDEMWQRDRTTSSLDLPEKRPKGLYYYKQGKNWRVEI